MHGSIGPDHIARAVAYATIVPSGKLPNDVIALGLTVPNTLLVSADGVIE